MFRSNPQVMQFHYDVEDRARKQFAKAKNWEPSLRAAEIEDDYNSEAIIRIDDIAGIFLTDVAKEMVAKKKDVASMRKAQMMGEKEAMQSLGQMIAPASKPEFLS
jgi:hypothetical protein